MHLMERVVYVFRDAVAADQLFSLRPMLYEHDEHLRLRQCVALKFGFALIAAGLNKYASPEDAPR